MTFLKHILSSASSGPLGIFTWIGAGVLAWIVGRLIRPGRLGALLEAAVSIVTALLGGLGATALDFGGWRVVDWRGALFALLCGLTSVALARLASLQRKRRSIEAH